MTNSSSDNDHCPHCHKPRKIHEFDLLGVHFSIPMSCDCELAIFEQERREFQQAEQDRQQARRRKHSGLTGAAADATLANFKLRTGTEKALTFVNDYLADWPKNRSYGEGFCLIGEYGNGKSHLAAAVVNELISRQVSAVYAPVTDLIKRIQATFDGGKESEQGIMTYLQDAQFLVLDDIGTQRQTEWARELLFNLIDYRYRHKLPTSITTNCSAVDGEQSLTQAIGGRVVDRLLERNVFIRVTASSYRRELARGRGR